LDYLKFFHQIQNRKNVKTYENTHTLHKNPIRKNSQGIMKLLRKLFHSRETKGSSALQYQPSINSNLR